MLVLSYCLVTNCSWHPLNLKQCERGRDSRRKFQGNVKGLVDCPGTVCSSVACRLCTVIVGVFTREAVSLCWGFHLANRLLSLNSKSTLCTLIADARLDSKLYVLFANHLPSGVLQIGGAGKQFKSVLTQQLLSSWFQPLFLSTILNNFDEFLPRASGSQGGPSSQT